MWIRPKSRKFKEKNEKLKNCRIQFFTHQILLRNIQNSNKCMNLSDKREGFYFFKFSLSFYVYKSRCSTFIEHKKFQININLIKILDT